MSTIARTRPRPETLAQMDDLPADLAALIPDDAPDFAGPGWVGEWLGISPQTVAYAIRVGKLPALAIPGARGTVSSWAVRPADAARLWGHRALNRRAREAAATTS